MADFLFNMTYLLDNGDTATVVIDVTEQPNRLMAAQAASDSVLEPFFQNRHIPAGRTVVSVAATDATRPIRAIQVEAVPVTQR